MQYLSERLLAELKQITIARAPREAVGLILSDGSVVELPNHAKGQSQFEAHKSDMLQHLTGPDIRDVTLWHSHPGGGVGPSREDMREKTPFPGHLVVALVDDDIVCSWY